jgi:hypothetical protein
MELSKIIRRIVEIEPAKDKILDEAILEVVQEFYKQQYYYSTKVGTLKSFDKIKNLDDASKISVCFRILEYQSALQNARNKYDSQNDKDGFDIYYKASYMLRTIMDALVRSKLGFTESSLLEFQQKLCSPYLADGSAPYSYYIKQFQYFLSKNQSTKVLEFLKKLLNSDDSYIHHAYRKEKDKFRLQVQELLQKYGGTEAVSVIPEYPPVLWSEEDSIGITINREASSIKEAKQRGGFYKLFALCKKATGGKPTGKILKEAEGYIEEISKPIFYQYLNRWLELYLNFIVEKETRSSTGYNNRVYTYDVYHNINSINADIIKPLVWISVFVLDNLMIHLLAKVAEKAYKKIPGQGPANAAIGNACFYALASSKSMEAVTQLSRLKLKLKQSSVIKLIDGYIEELAAESGVSKAEMEDMAVQEYGLQNGKAMFTPGTYKAEVVIQGIGKVNIHWYNEEGKELKSVPASLKTSHKDELKKITDSSKDIQKVLSTQRDRLDRSYIQNRSWTMEKFNKYFFQHGLMSFLAKQLVWSFTEGKQKYNLLFHDNQWIDYNGDVHTPSEKSIVTLWHPIGHTLEEVMAWRDFLMNHEIKQPLKQAFREVYILTDAELETKNYSNRMAAHILKQHQFNTLAKGRLWTYSLLGAYDDGRDGTVAELNMPEHGIKADFWINEIYIQDSFNDAGIWNYVGTDQLRFLDKENKPLDLVNIDPLVFSEVLRDTDLFVGVAGVGNDPEWRDRGDITQNHRNYWEGYSFGNLNETAKIRKQVLEKLLPRLKIAKVAEIKEKFLIVKGKIRTYKIHIGSTNILMEPNDEYLCIVSDRAKDSTQKLFLPFEGDSGLSMIISKAMLLAEDDKIIDTTILNQIKKNN